MSSDLDSSFDETLKCSTSACINDQDQNRIQCGDCKRSVHYRCTMLPAYQIQLFINKRSMKFSCANCVTVQKNLVDLLKSQDVPFYILSRDKEEIHRLRKELKACENLLKIQDDNQKQLKDMIMSQAETNKAMELSIINNTKDLMQKSLILEKEKILIDLKECVRAEAKEIFTNIGQQQPSKSYADAIGKPIDFKSILQETQKEIMKVAKIEDISEERDRRLRASNLIIHGIKETDSVDYEVADKEWFNTFLKDIDTTTEVKFVGRIGQKTALKNRPLKIVLKDQGIKRSIFSKLKNLKGKENYKGVSVSEDFTAAERSVIKSWIERAKEKNENETSSKIIYRVRGSPKTGTMRLKKFSNDEQWQQI